MPRVRVKVSAGLTRLLAGRYEATLTLPEGSTVADLLTELGACPGEIGLVVRNGYKADQTAVLDDGDEMELYPLIGGG